MADERDFELLDDYLTNRMREQDRSAFEQRLQSDPDLLQEYTVQKRVIQGIKDARVAQLKSMLNQVPVPSSSTGNALASKVFIGAVVAIVIAAAALWFYRNESAGKEQSVQPAQETTTPFEEPANTSAAPQAKNEQPSIDKSPQQESDRNQTSAGTEHSKPSLAKRPDPVSPPAGGGSSSTSASNKAAAAAVTVHINHDSRYNFHYQFVNGKLTLYGPFEKGGHVIVAIQQDAGKLLSLYYKEKYYQLTETISEIRELEPVTDPALISKLERQRTSN